MYSWISLQRPIKAADGTIEILLLFQSDRQMLTEGKRNFHLFSASTRRWIPRPAEAGQGTDGRMLEELDVVASAGRRGLLEGRCH